MKAYAAALSICLGLTTVSAFAPASRSTSLVRHVGSRTPTLLQSDKIFDQEAYIAESKEMRLKHLVVNPARSDIILLPLRHGALNPETDDHLSHAIPRHKKLIKLSNFIRQKYLLRHMMSIPSLVQRPLKPPGGGFAILIWI